MPSRPRSPPLLTVFEMSTMGSLTAEVAGLNTRTRPARSATQISRRPLRVAIAIGEFIVATRRSWSLMASSGVGAGGAVVGVVGGVVGGGVGAGAPVVAGAVVAGAVVV